MLLKDFICISDYCHKKWTLF